MFTFSLFLMPLAIWFYCVQTKRKSDSIFITAGFLLGIIVLTLKEFFSFSHRIVEFSFWSNLFYIFFRETFLPVVLIFGFFLLISKDEKDFKLKAFFPLLASFYIVYLPYSCFTSPEPNSAFEYFFKPVLILNMLCCIHQAVKMISCEIKQTPLLFILGLAILIISMVLPALAETFFLIGSPYYICIILTVISFLVPAAGVFYQILKK